LRHSPVERIRNQVTNYFVFIFKQTFAKLCSSVLLESCFGCFLLDFVQNTTFCFVGEKFLNYYIEKNRWTLTKTNKHSQLHTSTQYFKICSDLNGQDFYIYLMSISNEELVCFTVGFALINVGNPSQIS